MTSLSMSKTISGQFMTGIVALDGRSGKPGESGPGFQHPDAVSPLFRERPTCPMLSEP